MDAAFEESTLEDPAQALAEARGQADSVSRRAEEHAAPASRSSPAITPGAAPSRRGPCAAGAAGTPGTAGGRRAGAPAPPR